MTVPLKSDKEGSDKNNSDCNEDVNTTNSQLHDSTASNGELVETQNKQQATNGKFSLLTFDEAPEYLKFNKYIRKGYRGQLAYKICVDSIFWWTNETINIWSHVTGFFLFLFLMAYDLILLQFHASSMDKIVVGGLLICFQVCMCLSAMYHTFNCHSEESFNFHLKLDLLGITFSLLAIYLSGIYYAFWCDVRWCIFYVSTVAVIFVLVITIQLLSSNQQLKLIAFISWAVYGIIPTIHWAIMMGGYDSPIVQRLLPRIAKMYLISGAAFGAYVTAIPERFLPGRFDYVGASHQLWHIIVVIALHYWHNTGINYIEYRMNYTCLPIYEYTPII